MPRADVDEVLDHLRRISGSVRYDPLQLVLVVMFVGVIIVGIWHGMVTQKSTDAIEKASALFDERTKVFKKDGE